MKLFLGALFLASCAHTVPNVGTCRMNGQNLSCETTDNVANCTHLYEGRPGTKLEHVGGTCATVEEPEMESVLYDPDSANYDGYMPPLAPIPKSIKGPHQLLWNQ